MQNDPINDTSVIHRDLIELRLQQEEERYVKALTGTIIGFWHWNIVTNEQYVSPHWKTLLGFTEEEISTPQDFFFPRLHPDDRPRVEAALHNHFHNSVPYDVELRLLTKNGTYLWFRSRGQAEWDKDGHPICMSGTLSDISEQKKSEEMLHLLQAAIARTNDIVIILDDRLPEEGGRRVIFVNDAFTRLTGYSSEEIIGSLPRIIFSEENEPEVVRRVCTSMQDGCSVRAELLNTSKEGKTFWVDLDASPIFDPSGKITHWVIIERDITARKEVEERYKQEQKTLKESEARFQSVIAAMHDGLVVQNVQGEIILCNKRAEMILGLTVEQMTGRTSLDPRWRAIHADGSPFPGDKHPAILALHTGQTFRDVVMGVHKSDNTLTWISINADPLFHIGESELYAVVATFEDITERYLMEEEKERLMAEATRRADHDSLTGLLNHRAFHDQLQEAADARKVVGLSMHEELAGLFTGNGSETPSHLTSERRTRKIQSTSLAVAVLDIDNFKFFNDTYGHLAGDAMLRLVANALRNCCRQEDVIARIGGDEFAVMMKYVNRADAKRWGERLRACAYELSYQPPDGASPIPLRLSVGIALFPEDARTIIETLDMADKLSMQDKMDNAGDEDTHDRAEELRALLNVEVDGFAMLDSLVTAVDSKDRYTRRHSEEVMRYVTLIAEGLGLSDAEKSSLQVAALIHDVGKIGVPNKILRRPGQLSRADFEKIRQHPILGALLVGAVPELAHTVDAIKHHNERWAGGGYPSGLRGEEIPLSARIMAVADAYSAMTTNRPYRRGMSPTDAVGLLRAGAGTQWDRTCVNALLARL